MAWKIFVKVKNIDDFKLANMKPVLEELKKVKVRHPDLVLQIRVHKTVDHYIKPERLEKILNFCYGIYPILFVIYIVTFCFYCCINLI